MENSIQWLRQKKIYITPARVALLNYFLLENKIVELTALLASEKLNIDRTTLFRALNLFIKQKIILRIPSADKHPKYILYPKMDKQQMKLVCICKNCKGTFFQSVSTMNNPTVLDHFHIEEMTLLLEGICLKCKN